MSSSPDPSTADPTSTSALDPTPLMNEYLASPPEEDTTKTMQQHPDDVSAIKQEYPPPPPLPPPPSPTPVPQQQQQQQQLEQQPPPEEEELTLKLVKPENIRSRFWVHFHKYDLASHPDKKNTARCNMCGKDISVKQGTGGLKNHLKFKHPIENSALFDIDDMSSQHVVVIQQQQQGQCVKVGGGGHDPQEGAVVGHPTKKSRRENAYMDITTRMDNEKRNNEKHWMEMWALTRRELRVLRQELKDEDDEGAIKELEGDMKVMEQKKRHYAELLGYENDAEVSSSTENV